MRALLFHRLQGAAAGQNPRRCGLVLVEHGDWLDEQRRGTLGLQPTRLVEKRHGKIVAASELVGGHVAQYPDFRKLLEDKNVDAVVVATPDHWHALMTMMACAAGKDVYVEKPLTLFVREGRWMVAVARRHKRVVQVGTQQRSGPHYQRARELIRSGRIGKLVSVQVNYFRNVSPGFGK